MKYGAGIPGVAKRVPLASDKNVARIMLVELVKKAERGEVGLEDKTTEAGKTRLTSHLEDFRSSQRAAAEGITEKQVAQNQSRLRTVFDACGFIYPDDIDGDDVAGYLADRRRLPKAEERPVDPNEQLLLEGWSSNSAGGWWNATGCVRTRSRQASGR